jgi:hypothetical protein
MNRAEMFAERFGVAGRFKPVVIDGLIPARENVKEQQGRKETAEISVDAAQVSHENG